MHASSLLDVTPSLATPVVANARPVETPATMRQRWRGETPRSTTISPLSLPAGGSDLKPIHRKIDSMPVWLVSLIVHLIALMVLAFITTSTDNLGDLMLTIRQDDDRAVGELIDFSIEPVEWEALRPDEMDHSEVLADSEFDLATNVLSPIESETSIELASFTSNFDPFELPSAVSMTRLPTTTKNMFRGRTGPMKEKLLREAGGTKETEDAVALGLAWLKRQQQSDGSWSLRGPYQDGSRGENKISATSMAMLALMGSGSTHRGGQYQKELWQAACWLVQQQDRQGFVSADANPHEKMYSQAQATIVLCELYAMTGDSWIRPYAQAACDFAVRSQSPQGGWRYQPRQDSDTSVTGWFVMGLKSGEAGGLEVDAYVWPKVAKYLDSVGTGYGGGYAYVIGDVATPSMTAEGLLCRQYTGAHRNMPGMAQGLGSLVAHHPINARAVDVYYWYYATQSLHHYGGPLWTQWNDELKVVVPARQEKAGREIGSWSPQGDAWGRHAGRLYTTCFSIYCLEVYYRHLPLYDLDDADDDIEDRPGNNQEPRGLRAQMASPKGR